MQVLTPQDWALWRELRLAALTEAPAAFGSTLAEWRNATEARWRKRLSDVALNLVLRLDGEPAGMVSATSDPVELISMWIAPFARGRGVGDTAIRGVLDWAGGREVILSVKAANEPAIRLYARHGFVDAGPSPDDSCELLMRRPALK